MTEPGSKPKLSYWQDEIHVFAGGTDITAQCTLSYVWDDPAQTAVQFFPSTNRIAANNVGTATGHLHVANSSGSKDGASHTFTVTEAVPDQITEDFS